MAEVSGAGLNPGFTLNFGTSTAQPPLQPVQTQSVQPSQRPPLQPVQTLPSQPSPIPSGGAPPILVQPGITMTTPVNQPPPPILTATSAGVPGAVPVTATGGQVPMRPTQVTGYGIQGGAGTIPSQQQFPSNLTQQGIPPATGYGIQGSSNLTQGSGGRPMQIPQTQQFTPAGIPPPSRPTQQGLPPVIPPPTQTQQFTPAQIPPLGGIPLPTGSPALTTQPSQGQQSQLRQPSQAGPGFSFGAAVVQAQSQGAPITSTPSTVPVSAFPQPTATPTGAIPGIPAPTTTFPQPLATPSAGNRNNEIKAQINNYISQINNLTAQVTQLLAQIQ